jgi:hypothetical protein
MNLTAGEAKQIRGNTKRLIVRRATGPILIETDKNESVELIQGDNVLFENIAGSMTIKDISGGANSLQLILVGSGEGDIASSAGAVEVANKVSITEVPAKRWNVIGYQGFGPFYLLPENENRKYAVISCDSPFYIYSNHWANNGLLVDGSYVHEGPAALWTRIQYINDGSFSGSGYLTAAEYLYE